MSVPRWKRFEREIARKFRRWFPDARRGMQFQDGDYSPDVVGKDLPFYVECKTGQKYLQAEGKKFNPDITDSLYELFGLYQRRAHLWYTENDGKDLTPIIIYKRPREAIMVFVLLEIVRELSGEIPDDNRPIPWDLFAQYLDNAYAQEAQDA